MDEKKPPTGKRRTTKARFKKHDPAELHLKASVTRSGFRFELTYSYFVEMYKAAFPKAADKLWCGGEDDPSDCIKLEISFTTLYALHALTEAYPDHKLSKLGADLFKGGGVVLLLLSCFPEEFPEAAKAFTQGIPHLAMTKKRELLRTAESRHQRSIRRMSQILTAISRGESIPEMQKARRKGRPTTQEARQKERDERRQSRTIRDTLKAKWRAAKTKKSGTRKTTRSKKSDAD